MKKLFSILVILTMFSLFGFSILQAHEGHEHEHEEQAAEKEENSDLKLTCAQLYERDGVCPKERCLFQCLGGIKTEGCKETCNPIPCVEIDAQHCPEFRCEVLKGCSGKDTCYYRVGDNPPKCGGIAFAGQSVECCEGLTPKCGVEFFDTSCDMIAEYSVYSVPICLPCGNGICNQFENRCNCPEDCLTE